MAHIRSFFLLLALMAYAHFSFAGGHGGSSGGGGHTGGGGHSAGGHGHSGGRIGGGGGGGRGIYGVRHSYHSYSVHSRFRGRYRGHARYHSYSGTYNSAYAHSGGLLYPMKGEHDLSLGGGLVSLGQLRDPTIKVASPTYFATFRYFISNGFAIGLTAGIQSLQGTAYYINSNARLLPYNYNRQRATVAVELTWLYSSRGLLQAYGSLGAGISDNIETENNEIRDGSLGHVPTYVPAFQFTPLGLRIGRTFGGFIEFGIGYKGLINGGISYQPGWKKRHPLL